MGKFVEGLRFGKWTTIREVRKRETSGRQKIYWEVRCDCGTIKISNPSDLLKGKSTQCRYCYGRVPKNLIGSKFGEWLVIDNGTSKNGKTYWLCKCSCGTEHNVCAQTLLNGTSTKCLDCYFKEMPIHGYSSGKNKNPLYQIWIGILNRCVNIKHKYYSNYGGRGITVSTEWHNFETFVNDIEERPSPKHSVDRIDNDKGYCKENCRWSSQKEQCRNTRSNKNITYNGETHCLTEWAEILDVKVDTLFHYLTRNTFEVAIEHFGKPTLTKTEPLLTND
jgi:hypothetical protein